MIDDNSHEERRKRKAALRRKVRRDITCNRTKNLSEEEFKEVNKYKPRRKVDGEEYAEKLLGWLDKMGVQ